MRRVASSIIGICLGTLVASSANAIVLLPKINEFVANHAGTDVYEFVEIYGTPNHDYSMYSVLHIEGDDTGAGVIDDVFTVGTTDSNGFWTTGFMSSVLENGTITLLLVDTFSGAAGNDLDTDNDGVLDSTPWNSIIDAVAVSDGGSSDRTYGLPVLSSGFDGIGLTVGGASRIPNGVDTNTAADWVRNDFDLAGIASGTVPFGQAFNTPGASNQVCGERDGCIFTPPEPVPEPATLALLSLGLAGLGLQRRRRAS